jgi:chromate reductase
MTSLLIISATDRKNSKTLEFSNLVRQQVLNLGLQADILDLHTEWPEVILGADQYHQKHLKSNALAESKILPRTHIYVVSPEYNGSFPGIFKYCIDIWNPQIWNYKHIALAGISEGRAGNLRGMDHLTDLFHHLKAHVYFHKLPVSGISHVLHPEHPQHQNLLDLVNQQLLGFLKG